VADLYAHLRATCDQLTQEFDQIPEHRRTLLKELADYIASKYAADLTPELTVICTHNSRRSHIGQLWLPVAAEYYDLPRLASYSGGTEATAFFINAVHALRQVGFQITGNTSHDNPRYLVQWRDDMDAYPAFSKKYDQSPPNPSEGFGAIMICNSASEACPVVSGADFRIALPFDDPKAFDGSKLANIKYYERALDIGREILYALSLIQD